MIVSINSVEKKFKTNGCGCCSVDLYLKLDREEILKELKRNVDLMKEATKVLGIDFLEFVCS